MDNRIIIRDTEETQKVAITEQRNDLLLALRRARGESAKLICIQWGIRGSLDALERLERKLEGGH